MSSITIEERMRTPPSMRQRHYRDRDHNRSVEIISSSSSDLPHIHGVEYVRPNQPMVIHQDHIIPAADLEIIREGHYVQRHNHGATGGHFRPEFERRGRARSVGYNGSEEESEYYIDTRRSSRGGRSRHGSEAGTHITDVTINRIETPLTSVQSGPSHRLSETALAVAGGAAAYEGLKHHHTSSVSSERRRARRHRQEVYELQKEEEHKKDRATRIVAGAGLGIAAAGAAKVLYDRRKHRDGREGREYDSYSSSSDDENHTGRHIAAAALGATAAGLAAHEIQKHQRHRRDSVTYYSDDGFDDTRSHRNGAVPVLAAAAVGATAAGMTAKHMQDRNRSRSSSRHSTRSKRSTSHKIRDAAIGIGAATLAAKKIRSRSRHRHSRSRSRSSSASDGGSSHKLRNAALGIGAAALAAHKMKQHEDRSRARSRSSNRSRHRSQSRGAALMKAAAVTVAGALAKHQLEKHQDRARSADAAARRRRRRSSVSSTVIETDSVHGHRHRGDLSDGGSSVVSSSTRRSSHGRRSRHGSASHGGGHNASSAQAFAYRVGEEVAEGIRRATTSRS